jgi:transcriptional regulator with XRE-family HTH domain
MDMIAYPFIDRAEIASNLKAAIAETGMTIRRVAEIAGVQESHLSRFLKTGKGIDPEKVAKIAQAINVDIRKIYAIAV